MNANKVSTQEIKIQNSEKKLKVEVELIPAESMPASLRDNTNVSKINVGGQEFYAVVGKTTTV